MVQIATPDEVTQAELESSLDKECREQAVRDAFASDLYSRWQGYREARREVEDEWLDALQAVKGEYGPEQEKVMGTAAGLEPGVYQDHCHQSQCCLLPTY